MATAVPSAPQCSLSLFFRVQVAQGSAALMSWLSCQVLRYQWGWIKILPKYYLRSQRERNSQHQVSSLLSLSIASASPHKPLLPNLQLPALQVGIHIHRKHNLPSWSQPAQYPHLLVFWEGSLIFLGGTSSYSGAVSSRVPSGM